MNMRMEHRYSETNRWNRSSGKETCSDVNLCITDIERLGLRLKPVAGVSRLEPLNGFAKSGVHLERTISKNSVLTSQRTVFIVKPTG